MRGVATHGATKQARGLPKEVVGRRRRSERSRGGGEPCREGQGAGLLGRLVGGTLPLRPARFQAV
jgi:hypothetical protein